ncbi:hypothetical protein TNCV_2058331 [Trichonephila clavipes]|nr:hypothetical protein TNCV_2058331 [Trichonephila clavipes]
MGVGEDDTRVKSAVVGVVWRFGELGASPGGIFITNSKLKRTCVANSSCLASLWDINNYTSKGFNLDQFTDHPN